MVGSKVAGTLRVPSAKHHPLSECRQQNTTHSPTAVKPRKPRPNTQLSRSEARLPTSFLGLGVALANLKLRVALANHVNSATTAHNLAIRVAILKRTDAADNFHGN